MEKPLTFRTAWRPFMAWVFGYISFLLWTAWSLCLFFLADKASEAVSITTAFSVPLGADLMALASIVTFYVHGRTKEKLEGKHDDGGVLVGAGWPEDSIGGRSDGGSDYVEEPLHQQGRGEGQG